MDHEGTPVPYVHFHSERSPIGVFLQNNNKVSFTMAQIDNDTLTPDSLYRVDMHMMGRNKTPVHLSDTIGDLTHQYRDTLSVTHVPSFRRVVYLSINDSVDAHFYYGSTGPRMAFVIRPGGNPAQIKLRFSGHDSLNLDWQGALRMHLNGRWIQLEEAIAYQVGPTGNLITVNWTAGYAIDDNNVTVGFTLGTYNTSLPLVIQVGYPPLLPGGGGDIPPCWSTYFGGNHDDRVFASRTDDDGNYFVTGYTYSHHTSFPSALGGVQIFGALDRTIFISGFDSDHALRWTTFYGAPLGVHPLPFDMAVRSNPTQVYVVGHTPPGLPLVAPPGTYMDNTPGSGNTGFIGRFDIEGLLQWSTYFGEVQTSIFSADIDAAGRLLIAGGINWDVPVPETQPAGAFYQPYSGGRDAFVASFYTNDALRWSTCIGGSDWDSGRAVRSRGSRIVVAGNTYSSDLTPILAASGTAYNQPANAGDHDLFITEFDLSGALQWSTYFGSDGQDIINSSQAVRMGPDGGLVIVGECGASMDIVPGAGWYSGTAPTNYPKCLFRFNGATRERDWTTFIANGDGPGFVSYPECVAFDDIGNLYLAGGAYGEVLQTVHLDGIYNQPTPNTGLTFPHPAADGFIMSFTPDNWLAWSTYFGGDDGSVPGERINTLAWHSELLYAAGFTSKASPSVPPTSYFPLHDPGNGAWFSGVFSGAPPYMEHGFIAAFCTDPVTSTGPVREPQGPMPRSQHLGGDN